MDSYRELSDIYDELINNDIDYEGWATFIMEKCKKYNVNRGSYLDLACGTGNLTIHLSNNFKNCWAVDLSPYMLTKAEEKLRRQKVKFICQNICKLNINRKFNLATCALDGTNYILNEEEVLNFFKGVYNHLEEEALFIFDINSYYKLTEVMGNNIFNYDSGDVTYIWENYLEDDILEMYLTFFIKEGELYKRFDECHKEKAYDEKKIEDLLKQAGFSLREKLDGYTNATIKDHSERILFVAQK
ncbi:class I SAM-dependent methyltransferase [Hathewaya histolytica]|uniref:S-adenosylmethionine-dependent methyltransferase n=1 Tax=Hathewaya histolytica TaxID=1498 RepID=A0A4U9RQ58_HATHI|nr:class I SAM-dependent methyltransferase [Hathewaya histolytica]VTQ92943.1 S-adenosylmethionine-dependent methyltransferase [Hathewaya histolytica]